MIIQVTDKGKQKDIKVEDLKVNKIKLKDFHNDFNNFKRDYLKEKQAEKKMAKDLERLWLMIK